MAERADGAARAVGVTLLLADVDHQARIERAAEDGVAQQQRPVTYKANFDAANARGQALENQLKPLVAKFEADRQAPKPNVPALQAQAKLLQDLQERGKQEIQQQLMPVALSEAYVAEQIEAKLDQAVQHATTEMLRWLDEDYGLDASSASILLGQCVEYDLGNIFDPAYTMVCKVAKALLTGL